MSSAGERSGFKVSVVVPVYNERQNLFPLVERLVPILGAYAEYEIIFVDDGSTDDSVSELRRLHEENERIQYVSFSRNFGHQNALRAGLTFCTGDCAICMDGDLQHPPEMVPDLIERWQAGNDVVYTVRDDRNTTLFKKSTAAIFYRLANVVSDVHMDHGAADFRLLDRKVVDVLRNMEEPFLFLRGMIPWLGFRQARVAYLPQERASGESKYTLRKMVRFALAGITSFSVKPLRLSTYLGLFIAGSSFLYASYAVIMKVFTNRAISGWASVLASVLLVGGIQLIMLGIIGEYIGKLFIESKRRPNYVIAETSF